MTVAKPYLVGSAETGEHLGLMLVARRWHKFCAPELPISSTLRYVGFPLPTRIVPTPEPRGNVSYAFVAVCSLSAARVTSPECRQISLYGRQQE